MIGLAKLLKLNEWLSEKGHHRMGIWIEDGRIYAGTLSKLLTPEKKDKLMLTGIAS